MKKVKIGLSFFALVLLCFLTNNILLLINYFSALILHEMAHLFVAISKGYKLKKLHLSMFGLHLDLNEKIDDGDSFLINIAGPSINLLLAVVCVALFWIFPASYTYLKSFCIANLSLAIFNLIPIYPLDGGKIFGSLFKNRKHYLVFNNVVKYLLVTIFAGLFIISCFNTINFIYLIICLFFISLKNDKTTTVSLFKFSKKNKINKVVMLKIDKNITLFNLLKLIKTNNYTIFYCKDYITKYIDEDTIIDLSLKYPLTTALKDTF